MHGFSCPGHFAEYSLADSRNAMVLPDGMDMVTAAPLFCAGITGKPNWTVPGARYRQILKIVAGTSTEYCTDLF